MTKLRESVLRQELKPRVESDLPGRLRILFPRYALLPDAAAPYLHYVEEILKMLRGVHTVRLNPRIGSVLILYDPSVCTSRLILRWIGIATETGIEIAREIQSAGVSEEKRIVTLARQRLALRVPGAGAAEKQGKEKKNAEA